MIHELKNLKRAPKAIGRMASKPFSFLAEARHQSVLGGGGSDSKKESGPVLVHVGCGQAGHPTKEIHVAKMMANIGSVVGESCLHDISKIKICGKPMKILSIPHR